MSGECPKCLEHPVDCQCNNVWIGIEDRSPPTGTEVLTYLPDAKWYSCFNAAWYDGEDFWFDTEGTPIRGITHWMPLPEAPHECPYLSTDQAND